MIDVQIHKQLRGARGVMSLVVKQQIQTGHMVAIYGASGAGKTSLLRILAGLMNPDSGSIHVNGQTWVDTKTNQNLKPGNRQVGVVFQDFALFPNMSVRENLNFAIKNEHDSSLVTELIKVVELEQLENRKPSTLSGGQQQRVALARALAGKPLVLLLDEPLSALDRKMRNKLQGYLLQVHQNFKLTTLLVSHDVGEIFRLSDQVMHLESGEVKSYRTPIEMFSHRHLSGKFQFTGEVIDIVAEDVIFVVTVLIDNHLVKIIADGDTASSLSIGDQVLVASKAFNPIIRKI